MNSQLRPEDNLLLCCAQKSIDYETECQLNFLLKQDLDWSYFSALVFKHGLTPLVYWNLNKIDFKHVPEPFREVLKNYFNQNAKKNLLMLSELLNVLNVLKSAGILAIPYKGPILAIFTYGGLVLREFGDLDIFVQKEFFFQVENLMIGLGYEPVLKLTNEQKKLLIRFQREYKFINDKRVPIEIKWRFPVVSFSFKEDPIVLCDYVKLSYNNNLLNLLKPENLLLVLCLHNAGHYWSNLRGICDIVELINTEDINWFFCLSLSKKMGIMRILSINLILAKNLFNLTLPKNVLSVLEEDDKLKGIYSKLFNNLFSDEDFKLYDKIILRLSIRENTTNKIKDLVNLFLIPTTSLLDSVSLPSYLTSFYHILRIIQLLNSYVFSSIRNVFFGKIFI